MSTRAFGARVKRNVDPKLLKGEGSFIDDLDLPGVLHAAFVRSPFARAKITKVDTEKALSMNGVKAVYTCDNIGNLDMELPLLIPHDSMKNARTQRTLARDDVFHVGQAIAMVVATDRYLAEDAALMVDVDYEPMDVEVDIEKAILPNAPLVHHTHPNNIAADFTQISGDPEPIFASAEHVTKIRVEVERSTAAPLETRSIAAHYDSISGNLNVWDGTQAP